MSHTTALWRSVLAGAAVSAVLVSSANGQLSFSDQSAVSGLTFTHEAGPGYPSQMIGMFTSGGAVGDFDRDGWQDVFIPSDGTNPNRLCMNQHDGTFADAAVAWNLDHVYLGAGVAVGDYNNDHWLDIYVTSFGEPGNALVGAHRLYRNNGDGTFSEVAAAAGVNQTAPTDPDGMGAAWGDYDLDGDLDLFVTGWREGSFANRLFRNNGDETFTDVTASSGDLDELHNVRGFGAVFCDMNGDRWPELLVVGDMSTSKYFINNGDSTFTEYTIQSGTGLEDAGMGQTIGDYNNDQLIDWYVTTIHWTSFPNDDGNRLYINEGSHTYNEIGQEAGVKEGGWGWGAITADFNLDGLQDLGETNGWNTVDHQNFPSRLWVNNGDLTFDDVAASTGFIHTGDGRGMLRFDYDRDGDQDVIIFAHNEPLTLYRNDIAAPDANWLTVALDTSSRSDLAPDGYGAIVRVTIDGVTQSRPLAEGTQFLSQSELVANFGLGAATTIDEVRVEWLSGEDTVLTDVAANQFITITPPGDAADLTDFDVTFGSVVSGGLAELLASDDLVLDVASQFGFSALEPNIVAILFGFDAGGPAGTLGATIESRLNNPGGIAQLKLRDWSTGQLTLVHEFAIGTTEITETVTGIDADDFVQSRTNRVELQAKTAVIATFSATGFEWFIDLTELPVD